MGQAAAGGVQDPGIPRGYQPTDARVAALKSPIGLQDDDGLAGWGPPAKSPGIGASPYSGGLGGLNDGLSPKGKLPSFKTECESAYASSHRGPSYNDANLYSGHPGYGGAGGGAEPMGFSNHADLDAIRPRSPAGPSFPSGAARNDSVLGSARMHSAMDSFASEAVHPRGGGRDDTFSDWGSSYGGGATGKPQPYASAASDYGGPGGRGASDYGGPTGRPMDSMYSDVTSDCKLGRTGAVPQASSLRPSPQSSHPRDWDVGSIVECFSATSSRWFPARVMQVQPGDNNQEVLTVQFYMEDEAKQKSMYRDDSQMQALGTHTTGELPPGFYTKPSQSRPGQLVYMDGTTCVKYGSAELAWRVHFERLMEAAPDPLGCKTVCAVPGRKALQGSADAHVATHIASPARAPGGKGCSPPKTMSLAQLQASALDDRSDIWGDDLSQSPSMWGTEMGTPAAGGFGNPHDQFNGKINLPSFGDAMGSQAAYLQYEGKETQANAAAAVRAAAPMPASTSGYPATRASAPRRPAPVKNPVLQTWQEDPFSEWRK